MADLSVQQSVELFHLLLLSFLGKKLDKRRYALKGGCNLRFFFGSPRYSEDMDIDVVDLPVHALQDTVNAILESNPFHQALQVHGMDIEHITVHKQSETTQRWKLGLHTRGIERPVPTKIEFSRRGFRGRIVLDSVDPLLLHRYRMAPFMTPHYPGEVAMLQKIEALATRHLIQARDIFDLHLLQSRERMRQIEPLLERSKLEAAKERALELSYDDFKGQVVAYLHPDEQAAYGAPEVWEAMQLNLIETLEDAD